MQGIDNRLQITLVRCERNVGDVAIGQAKASTIIANETETVGEDRPKPSPGGALPVVLKVGGPGGSTD
jgi:hypothetical protein